MSSNQWYSRAPIQMVCLILIIWTTVSLAVVGLWPMFLIFFGCIVLTIIMLFFGFNLHK